MEIGFIGLKQSDGLIKEDDMELQAEGVNGQIVLSEDRVVISRKGALGFLTQGLKGDKNIMVSAITSIQFKNATMWTNGYIKFAFQGGKEAKGGLFQATQDENSVMFKSKQQPAFEKIRDEVEKRTQVGSNSTITSSGADEVAKFAELRDKGILTEEEFQLKKKQILGL